MIHLAIAFDKNYLTPFYALASSIFCNNPNEAFTLHCITKDVKEAEKTEISDYLQENGSIAYFYTVDDTLIQNFVVRSHWNTSVYFKIFFPLLVDNSIKRLLYLDTDMLVLGKLRELYEIDLKNYPLAVVADPHVRNEAYWELHKKENYFNSGMMLIDLPKWNSLEISQKTLKILNENPEKIIYVDQDALNIALEDNFLLVSEKYNYTYTHIPKELSIKELKKQLSDITILHFTLSRPWHFLCRNPYRYLYRFYLKKTPKRNEKVITDFSYSKIFAYFRIRLIEFYLNTPFINKIWKFIKNI